MRLLSLLALLLTTVCAYSQSPGAGRVPALNRYVEYISRTTAEVSGRLPMLRDYYEAAEHYRRNPGYPLRLASSGPLETYYYEAARREHPEAGLSAPEIRTLNEGAERLWRVAEQLDEQCKALETYVRLRDYERDQLRQSDQLLRDLEGLFGQFSREKEKFQQQIEAIYRQGESAGHADAYTQMEQAMRKALEREKALLQTWPYYLNEAQPAEWPLATVQQHIAESPAAMAPFAQVPEAIAYPASDMVKGFRSSLEAILQLKRDAVDAYTHEARQSARHGNRVYLDLINYYNNDLLANYQAFVQYSASARALLSFPSFAPVFALEAKPPTREKLTRARPFKDLPLIPFSTHPAPAPIGENTLAALNHSVNFINVLLRQLNQWQLLFRNYESSAQYYRDPVVAGRRSALTFSYRDMQLPHSLYQQVMQENEHLPAAYRPSVRAQTEVLMNVLKELDALSVELVGYTVERTYEHDGFRRSDEILQRSAELADILDAKKEQLYRDLRRIFESYPAAQPASAWYVSGQALLTTLDQNTQVLRGIREYLQGKAGQVPGTRTLEEKARGLMAEEYKNMKGLTRYGRSNGLCPYSPYEDIADNSLKMAQKVEQLERRADAYESFYYFYNNQLIDEYNRFCGLAKVSLLKNIYQPNLYGERRWMKARQPAEQPATVPVAATVHQSAPEKPVDVASAPERSGGASKTFPDTVYISRVDTVYIERDHDNADFYSLEGYATNNLVLLLDVSASMNAPGKMPLLKKSVGKLLQMLRPEDQVSIVVYSGKARVVLEPTPGTQVRKIEEAISDLHSDGGTDANAGIRLAYRLANKSYIRGGNNRIILATDGEFSVSRPIQEMVETNARADVYLSVFHFNHRAALPTATRAASQVGTLNLLQQLAAKGKGSYEIITPANGERKLITEARARKAR